MNTSQSGTKAAIQIGDVRPVSPCQVGGGNPLVVIAGPCVIESRDQLLFHAEKISAIIHDLGLALIFKSSYDKANRTSHTSFRGVGLEEGLAILAEVREQFQIPVITDVHSVEEAHAAGEVVDVLQIPAFLCRQTDLLYAAGQTKKPVMVKKGQFLAPPDMLFAARKIVEGGSERILLCERGSCFGYRDLVVDFRGLQLMAELGYPVIFDATHSVQSLGGGDGKSSGNRKFIPILARAAVAAGVAGVFLECHQNPDQAPSDAASMLPLTQLRALVSDLKALDELRLETRDT